MISSLQVPILKKHRHISHAFGSANDDIKDREHKYQIICQELGFPANTHRTVKQVHGNYVLTLTEDIDSSNIEADAIVTTVPGLLLCVQTADCTPILLVDPSLPIVAAVHSGWRSAFNGVVENTVQAMLKLGGKIDRIIAAIGPTIRQHNYEVDEAFKANFVEHKPLSSGFFIKGRPNHHLFNLPGYCQHVLEECGVGQVYDSDVDTYSNSPQYYSYRRSTHAGQTGGPILGQVSAIGILHTGQTHV